MVLKNEEDDKKNTHYKDHKAKYEQAAVRSMTAEVKFYDLVVKKNFDDDMWHTSVGSILTQIHQAIGVIKTCQNHQMSHFIRSLAKHVLQLGQPKENKKVRAVRTRNQARIRHPKFVGLLSVDNHDKQKTLLTFYTKDIKFCVIVKI
jgi:hypothetical protein